MARVSVLLIYIVFPKNKWYIMFVYRVLPKTDNTYSPDSKYYKYEVSPGIPFIPNMSRLPLKSYERTSLKHDFSENLSNYISTSSHISSYNY